MLATSLFGVLVALVFGVLGLSPNGNELERFIALSALFVVAAAASARHEDERTEVTRWHDTVRAVLVFVGVLTVIVMLPLVSVLAAIVIFTLAVLVYLFFPLFMAWSLDEDETSRPHTHRVDQVHQPPPSAT